MKSLRALAKIFLLAFVSFAVFLTGCASSTEPKVDKVKNNSEFAIYLVQGSSVSDALESEINQLLLEKDPVLKESEIARYNWKKQEFELLSDVLNKRLQGKIDLKGKPFVVTVGDERSYVGAFWSFLSSLSPPNCPVIESAWTPGFETKVYRIRVTESSIVNDKRIYNALGQAGLLKE